MPVSPASPLTLPRRSTRLSEIRQPVSGELAQFQDHFREQMATDVWLLDRVVQYVLKRKGKQVRPMLVLLTAKASGGVTQTAYEAASLVELLHTATLVHDDVVDEADRRRGQFSINAVWKNKVAVLLGDYLLSRGLLMALDANAYGLLHTVSDAVRRMSEGELLQLEKSRRLDIDEPTYYKIISGKTASLLSACTACGALSAGATDEQIQRMRQAGEELGLAFQIKDDLFDYGTDDIGKPVGNDLVEKKMTLPLIHALEQAGSSDRRRIRTLIKRDEKSAEDIAAIVNFVREAGGLRYAEARMQTHAADAKRLFGQLPASDARDALVDLVTFVVERKK